MRVAGLLSMREGWPFTIHAHAKVLAILKTNSIFNVLNEKNVRRQPIKEDEPFEPDLPNGSPPASRILPFAVAGKSAWYLEGQAHPAGNTGDGDTLGPSHPRQGDRQVLLFLAACAGVSDELKSRLKGAPLIFFDGTVWRDDELIVAGLGNKTGQGMGHIAMSGDSGAIAALAGLDIDRKVFLHITIPTRRCCATPRSARWPSAAGWQIPADGTEFIV